MSEPTAIYQKIEELVSGLGVSTYVIVFQDPDSDRVLSKQSGSTLWRIGSLTTQLEQAKQEWQDE